MPTPATCTRYDEESEDESPFKCPSLSDDDSSLEARSGKNQCIEADTSDDDEDNDSDLEAEMVLQQIKGRGKKRKKAAGRKSTWPLTALMELTDVICSSERLKRELIFTNTRNKKNSEFYGEVRDELATRYPANISSKINVESTLILSSNVGQPYLNALSTYAKSMFDMSTLNQR